MTAHTRSVKLRGPAHAMPSRTGSVSRHPWLQGWFVAGAVLAGCVGAPDGAASQTLWGEIPLPGGAKAAREVFSLGLSEDRPDGAWLADYLLRQLNVVSVLAPVPIEQYLATLETASKLQAEWPDGLVLPAVGVALEGRQHANRLEIRVEAFEEATGRNLAGHQRVSRIELLQRFQHPPELTD